MCALNELVVDDDRDAATGLANFLTLDGHAVDLAFSGEAAIGKAAGDDYDLVLLDVVLPGMNGFEAMSAIKRADLSARVVVVSGYWGASLEDTALDEAAVDVVPRPVDLDAPSGRMEDLTREWHSAPGNA